MGVQKIKLETPTGLKGVWYVYLNLAKTEISEAKIGFFAAQQHLSCCVIHATSSERVFIEVLVIDVHPFPFPFPPFVSPYIGYKMYTLLADAPVFGADTSFYASARAAVVSQEQQHHKRTRPLSSIVLPLPTWDPRARL